MAVITDTIEELGKRDGSLDSAWKRAYTRVFYLETDDRDDGPITVRGAAGIPQLGDHYLCGSDEDFGAFVVAVACKEGERVPAGGSAWEVTISYGNYDATAWGQNPLDWPIQLNWEQAQYTQAAEQGWDEDGNRIPILNSAGDPFADAPEIDDVRPVLKILRNEATYDPLLAQYYSNATNSDSVNIGGTSWEPYTIKIGPIPAVLKFSRDSGTEDGFYYEVTYEFHFNVDGWRRNILDQGLAERNGDGELVAISGADGKPITEPVLLDGDGARLASGGDPVYIEFHVYRAVPFAGLGFDFSGAPGA